MPQTSFFRKLVALLSLLALLLAGCGASAARGPSAAAPTAAPVAAQPAGDRLFIRDGYKGDAERLTIVDSLSGARERDLPPGVPSPDWATLYVAESDGQRTRVRALAIDSGQTLRETTLDGAYALPMVTPDSVLGGISPNGSWLALVSPSGQPKTRFLVLDTGFTKQPRVAELEGSFLFDGLSADGRSLYLTEGLALAPSGAYQVRRFDLALGQIDPNVVAAKGESGPMSGSRQTAVASRNGEWLYSLYLNPAHGPFIHALMMSGPVAFCIDLPQTGKADPAIQAQWSLALSPDGGRLYAANGALGLVVELNTGEMPPQIARSSTLFEAPAAQASQRVAGSTVTALAPDGKTLYTLGDQGLLVVDTAALKLRTRFLADWSLDGLALSADGRQLYVASAARGKIVRLDPLAGTVAAEVPAQGQPTGVVRVAPR